MKKLFNNEKGATSVLVIFMMIVLVTLGTFAITSALVNYRFAYHTVDWSKMYYKLEDKAENYLKDVNDGLINAANRAVKQVNSENGINLNEDFNKAYCEFALEEIKMLNDKYQQNIETIENDNVGICYLEQEFISDDNPDSHLTVKILIKKPDNYLSVKNVSDGDIVTIVNNNETLFEVVEWRQWQTPVEIEMFEDLWPGND